MPVREAMKKHGAVYLATVGGAGALLSKSIAKSELVAFEDAGPEALFLFEVVNFPAVVINDLAGNDYYEMVTAERLGVKYEKTI
jgi:fumarate hydratase subunit beta